MKRFLYVLIPSLTAIVLFAIIIVLFINNKDKGALQVTSVPSSKVYLNGKLLGTTPLCDCQLKDMIKTGDYTIELVPTKGDFDPFEQKITINPKALTVVDRTFASQGFENGSIITLSPISNKNDAQISVFSFPDSAQVYLDNNLKGQTPILLKNITESDHEIKLTRDGYSDKTVDIKTALGYKLEAIVFLGVNPQIATGSAAQAATSSAELPVSKILILQTPTGFLRVRQEASVSSNEIGQVNPGETYVLLNEQNGWYQIQLTNGKSGWISSQYAQKQ